MIRSAAPKVNDDTITFYCDSHLPLGRAGGIFMYVRQTRERKGMSDKKHIDIPIYEDIDYSKPVSEPIYDALVRESKRMDIARQGSSQSVLRHEIQRLRFKMDNIGRTEALEQEIIARTLVLDEISQ